MTTTTLSHHACFAFFGIIFLAVPGMSGGVGSFEGMKR